jgi:ABC-2 type transport system permease protein
LKTFRLAWNYLKIGVSNELQYRLNFLIQLFQSGVAVATGLIGLALVFSFTTSLGGWSQSELLTVMGIYILVGGFINSAIQPNMNRILQEIHRGTLDFALTKPVDTQLLVSLREFRFWSLTDVLVGLVVMGVAVVQLQERIGIWQVLSFLAALCLGAVMVYCFWLILTSVAFWVIRVYEMVGMFQSLYAAGRWPVSIYPTWLRLGLTFLVPVAFAVTVPAEALTSRLTPLTLLAAGGLAALFFGLARLVWRLGTRRYAGASA